jgi:transcriptional regulator with XRE-family HTH domain
MTRTIEPRPLQPRLGKRIRARREVLGMTQATLARQVGLSQPAIAYIEGGENTPSLGTIVGLANVLECAVGDLL